MQKITPCLWFDNQLDDAMRFYTGIFREARIGDVKRAANGRAFVANFELEGQRFMGLNGGPLFKFSEAVSFFLSCKDQEEVDYYWERLLDGGKPQQCGWLKDRFGLSWQIVPDVLLRYMSDADAAKAGRVQAAMMEMVKIEVAALEKAYAG